MTTTKQHDGNSKFFFNYENHRLQNQIQRMELRAGVYVSEYVQIYRFVYNCRRKRKPAKSTASGSNANQQSNHVVYTRTKHPNSGIVYATSRACNIIYICFFLWNNLLFLNSWSIHLQWKNTEIVYKIILLMNLKTEVFFHIENINTYDLEGFINKWLCTSLWYYLLYRDINFTLLSYFRHDCKWEKGY